MRTLLRLELLQILRGWTIPAALAVTLAAAVAGVLHGRTVIDRQIAALAESPALQEEYHRAILDPLPPTGTAGDQLYYLTFHTAHHPTPWAAVSVGQRDIQAYNLKIRMLALQGQLHNADLSNPLLAAFGHFDLSFVIVLLTPLLVIALSSHVWSAEREQGTWALVASQPTSPFRLLALKFAVRAAIVFTPMAAALAFATVVLDLPMDARLGQALLLALLYVTTWTGIAAVVVSLRRSSDFNAMALVGLWVVWGVLGPAAINVLVAARHPLPDALELTVQQRQGYHAAWDAPLPETMARFYERYPAWADVPVPEGVYSNAWYYAMQQRGDDAAAPAVAAYFETLDARRRLASRAFAFVPPASFQLALNSLARTDLESHVAYLRSVADFHERLKHHFFPVVFHDTPLAQVDFSRAPQHDFRTDAPSSGLRLQLVALGAQALAFGGVGLLLLRRRAHR
jgi:ABC-2 type transport system permease protein